MEKYRKNHVLLFRYHQEIPRLPLEVPGSTFTLLHGVPRTLLVASHGTIFHHCPAVPGDRPPAQLTLGDLELPFRIS